MNLFSALSYKILLNIVVYMLNERTVQEEKSPLLGNDPYIGRGVTRHVRCNVTQ